MLGNFTYCNPTKLYFGKDALNGLKEELPKYGKNVLLVYGGGYKVLSEADIRAVLDASF